jgi:hypothetical protein
MSFVYRKILKSSNSLRVGPRPKKIFNGFSLSKTAKSYGSFNALYHGHSPYKRISGIINMTCDINKNSKRSLQFAVGRKRKKQWKEKN